MRKSSLDWERKFCEFAEQSGFHSERVASSGSRLDSVCDVVIVKAGKACLVEVKSTKKSIFRINGRTKSQLTELYQACEACGAIPLLAVRFKRKQWKIVRVDSFQEFTLPSLADKMEGLQFYPSNRDITALFKGGTKICPD